MGEVTSSSARRSPKKTPGYPPSARASRAPLDPSPVSRTPFDARFRDFNHTRHLSFTRRVHLALRARPPAPLASRADRENSPELARAIRRHNCPRATSVVMPRETRARKPVSYADSGSSTPAWMVRARTPDDDESFAMCPFNGNFKSERLERVRARWRRSCDGERRAKTSW